MPAIYEEFSSRLLKPILYSEFGCETLIEWWQREITDLFIKLQRPIKILSLACGNGDLEIQLLKGLDRSVKYSFVGIDVNSEMLKRAKALAMDELLPNVSFELGDLNNPHFNDVFDVVLAHHSLHHIVELETLFNEILVHSSDELMFLIFDMIGQNGHKMWKATKNIVDLIWQNLPRKYKYNHYYNRTDEQIMDVDCSEACFEGIRAEDILPALNRYFQFEFYFPFATIINPFIDRAYGHNFDRDSEEDVQFIKDILELDTGYLKQKKLAPTQAFIKCIRKGRKANTRSLFQKPEESIAARRNTIDMNEEYTKIITNVQFPRGSE